MSSNINDAPLNNIDFIDGLHALNNLDGLLSDFEFIKKFNKYRKSKNKTKQNGGDKEYLPKLPHTMLNKYNKHKTKQNGDDNGYLPKLPRTMLNKYNLPILPPSLHK